MSANDQATPSADVPRKPRRRWLQLSLRTLLILVTLLCVALGWIVHRGERQRRAVAGLEELGAAIEYEASDSPRAERFFGLSRWLPRDYFDDVAGVDSLGSSVTDAGLSHIQGLTRLKRLSVNGTQVTDAGLTHIRGLTRLEGLSLGGTQVTDAGLAHLQGLTQLKVLFLDGTQVTDAGLLHVRDLTRLGWLYLDSTQVTDAGLVHVRGLTRLEQLYLNNTQVTDAGVAKLQRALPNCRIEH